MQQLYFEMAAVEPTNDVRKRRIKAWEIGKDVVWDQKSVFVNKGATDEYLKETMSISDAKSLYDSLKRTACGREPRVAVAVAEFRQSLAACQGICRWVPHNIMLCDPLTKEFGKSNAMPLLQCLRDGCYQISSEANEAAFRESVKEQGQTVQRLKGKSIQMVREDKNKN